MYLECISASHPSRKSASGTDDQCRWVEIWEARSLADLVLLYKSARAVPSSEHFTVRKMYNKQAHPQRTHTCAHAWRCAAALVVETEDSLTQTKLAPFLLFQMPNAAHVKQTLRSACSASYYSSALIILGNRFGLQYHERRTSLSTVSINHQSLEKILCAESSGADSSAVAWTHLCRSGERLDSISNLQTVYLRSSMR